MTPSIEEQLRAVFRDEAMELLSELRALTGLLRGANRAAIEQHVSTALRIAHNLKGAAGNVGLSQTERAAHAMEDALLKMREVGPAAVADGLPLLSATISAMELAAEGKGELLAAEQSARLVTWLGKVPPNLEEELPLTPLAPVVATSAHEHTDVAQQAGDALAPAQDASQASPNIARGRSIRIDTERLDRVFDFVSELLVTETDMRRRRGQLEELREHLDHRAGKREEPLETRVDAALRTLDGLIADNRRAMRGFSRLSQDLHQAMKRVRMVPLESLTAALRRTVDDAARVVKKSVDLEFHHANVELDKVVLDGLREPLMHLLRNAVDHGIEAPEPRELFGKPDRGLIRVSADMVGASVRIVVADDGRGIDPQLLIDALVDRGVVTAGRATQLSDEALIDFVFAEGFSTRDQVSSLSGRGVGLDAVRRAMTGLGGSVQASARGPLGGAAFTLTVPLSLLSTRHLLVAAHDNLYALPVECIDRVMRVPKKALRIVDGIHILQLDDSESMRLVWLSTMLSDRAPRDRDITHVLVLSRAGSRFAVAVDEVLREEEMVIRKLPWNFVYVPGVAGVTVLADGRVATVVDAVHLATRQSRAAVGDPESPRGLARVLVVDDSMTTRTLHRNVLSFAGYQVATANDGKEAWEFLRHEGVDAVVSDVQMPGMDGLELTRRIRSDTRLRNLKVILVTSLDGLDDRRRGAEAGADEYVVKGALERDALLSAVAKHLGP